MFIPGEILATLAEAFCTHDASCTRAPYLVLLNPGNYELLGWDELHGLPVLPDDRVEPMHCRLVCGTEGWAGWHNGQQVVWIEGTAFVWCELEESEEAA